MLGFRCHQLTSVRGHHLGPKQVVASETQLALQPPAAAAQGQPGDTSGRDPPAGDRQTLGLGGGVQLAPCQTSLGPDRCGRHVNGNVLHGPQIDADATITDGCPGDAMPAAIDRKRQVSIAGQANSRGHVIGVGTASDDRRETIDHAVETARDSS